MTPVSEKHAHLADLDAAAFLGTTPSTLRKSRVTGMLWGSPTPQFLKYGRVVRYRVSDLERWLAENGQLCSSTADALVSEKKIDPRGANRRAKQKHISEPAF